MPPHGPGGVDDCRGHVDGVVERFRSTGVDVRGLRLDAVVGGAGSPVPLLVAGRYGDVVRSPPTRTPTSRRAS